MKVKKVALALGAELHIQLGAPFRALSLSLSEDRTKAALEAVFEDNLFDPNASKVERTRKCLVGKVSLGDDIDTGPTIEVPTTDLVGELRKDCVERMVSVIRIDCH